jgi:hypothetical protein
VYFDSVSGAGLRALRAYICEPYWLPTGRMVSMSWTCPVHISVFLATLLVDSSTGVAEMGGDGRIDKTDSCYFVMTDLF